VCYWKWHRSIAAFAAGHIQAGTEHLPGTITTETAPAEYPREQQGIGGAGRHARQLVSQSNFNNLVRFAMIDTGGSGRATSLGD
jgi:hypothetical protein